MSLIALLLSLPAAGLSILSAWFLLEVIAPRPIPRRASDAEPGPIAVIIPAHNEAGGIEPTITDVLAQLRPADRLIVIADNCTDGTADAARAAGAEVIERQDETKRGKGYALQYGLEHLRENPPSTVVFTDADCFHEPGLLPHVAFAAEEGRQPAQTLYLMEASEDAGPSRRIAAFAWRLINKIRMEGLWTLAKTTRLTGAGAAFPWAVAEKLALGSGEIVEDLALTLTLAEQGTRVTLVPDFAVRSTFPDADDAATVQRARWEHGSLRMSRTRVPALLSAGLSAPWKAALALDVALPPITVFAVWIIAAGAFGVATALFGLVQPLVFAAWASSFMGLAILLAYLRDGQSVLPPQELARLGGFLASKLGVYGRRGRDSTKSWTRTQNPFWSRERRRNRESIECLQCHQFRDFKQIRSGLF